MVGWRKGCHGWTEFSMFGWSWTEVSILGSEVFGQAFMESTVIWMGLYIVLAASSLKTEDHVSKNEENLVLIIGHDFNIPIVNVQMNSFFY